MDQEEKIQTEYDEIDLMDYVKVLLKRKWLILAIFLSAAIVAEVFSFLMPKVYKIDTALEIGQVAGVPIEDPGQVVEKIKGDVYGIFAREKLGIPEEKYPKIKTENPKDTRLISLAIESAEPQQAKNILEEINNLILAEQQEKIKVKKGLLENNIEVAKKDIERIKAKIGFLEEERKNLEAKVEALQKILPYQQDPGTQFALFDTKEKLEQKKQEIENRYLEINSLENQINSLQGQIEDIRPTQVIESPTVSASPIKPRPLLNIVIAAILGLFIGVFLAFFQEWWEKSLPSRTTSSL